MKGPFKILGKGDCTCSEMLDTPIDLLKFALGECDGEWRYGLPIVGSYIINSANGKLKRVVGDSFASQKYFVPDLPTPKESEWEVALANALDEWKDAGAHVQEIVSIISDKLKEVES